MSRNDPTISKTPTSHSSSSLTTFSDATIQKHMRHEFRRCEFSKASTSNPIGYFTGYEVVYSNTSPAIGLQLNYDVVESCMEGSLPLSLNEVFWYIDKNSKLTSFEPSDPEYTQKAHYSNVLLKRRLLSLGISQEVLNSKKFQLPTPANPQSRQLDKVIQKVFLLIDFNSHDHHINRLMSMDESNILCARKMYRTDNDPGDSSEEEEEKQQEGKDKKLTKKKSGHKQKKQKIQDKE